MVGPAAKMPLTAEVSPATLPAAAAATHLREGARQLAEFLDAEFFGPCGVADVGAVEERVRFNREGLQRLAEHLPALAEPGFGDSFEVARVGGIERRRVRRQLHHR